MTEVWVKAMNAGEQQAYADGAKAATPEQSAEDVGFEKGWRAGYEAGFKHVIGHVGTTALRADPDDYAPPC